MVASSQTDHIRTKNFEAGQWILADETGGAPVLNANDPGQALHALMDQDAGHYVLGFGPEREPDGRSHALRVELRKKGPRIRHRMSYWHRPGVEVAAGRSLSALFFGLEDDTLGATIAASAGPAPGPSAGERIARVWISLPVTGLTAAGEGEARAARVRTVIAVRKEGEEAATRPVDVREKWIDVALPEPAGAGRREVVVDVKLGEGERELAVGVEDVGSSRATFKKVTVER
jgi:hypothetical protein